MKIKIALVFLTINLNIGKDNNLDGILGFYWK